MPEQQFLNLMDYNSLLKNKIILLLTKKSILIAKTPVQTPVQTEQKGLKSKMQPIDYQLIAFYF